MNKFKEEFGTDIPSIRKPEPTKPRKQKPRPTAPEPIRELAPDTTYTEIQKQLAELKKDKILVSTLDNRLRQIESKQQNLIYYIIDLFQIDNFKEMIKTSEKTSATYLKEIFFADKLLTSGVKKYRTRDANVIMNAFQFCLSLIQDKIKEDQ